MAITQAVCNSFKKELLDGDHSFKQTGGDTYKLSLYASSATLNSSTTKTSSKWVTLMKNLRVGSVTISSLAMINCGCDQEASK